MKQAALSVTHIKMILLGSSFFLDFYVWSKCELICGLSFYLKRTIRVVMFRLKFIYNIKQHILRSSKDVCLELKSNYQPAACYRYRICQ
jgi:hypothetical protein